MNQHLREKIKNSRPAQGNFVQMKSAKPFGHLIVGGGFFCPLAQRHNDKICFTYLSQVNNVGKKMAKQLTTFPRATRQLLI